MALTPEDKKIIVAAVVVVLGGGEGVDAGGHPLGVLEEHGWGFLSFGM